MEATQFMKHTQTLLSTLAFTALSVTCALSYAQTIPTYAVKAPECRVKDVELQGKYVGECDPSGWAQGKGAAKGVDASYTGEFKDGEKHGYGVKMWTKTGDRYVGQFKKELPDGLGMYVWGEKSGYFGYQYIGQYVQDKRHGQGIFNWPNGEGYAGRWVDDAQTEGYTPTQIQQAQETDAKAGRIRKP
jgi:hypothetical protein